jgi:hypothetical protein
LAAISPSAAAQIVRVFREIIFDLLPFIVSGPRPVRGLSLGFYANVNHVTMQFQHKHCRIRAVRRHHQHRRRARAIVDLQRLAGG